MKKFTWIEDDIELAFVDGGSASAESFQAQTRRAYGGATWETQTNDYQQELEAIYDEWIADTAPKLAKEQDNTKRNILIGTLVGLLLTLLQQAGRKGILKAMQLGAGGVLSPDALMTANRLIGNNEMWLSNSLIPAITDRLTKETADTAFMLGGKEAIGALLKSYNGRVASYAGGFWNSIFEGLGDALSEDPMGNDRRVERVLDDNAQHCKTCPGKAKIYDNWDAMVAQAGIPGSGQDECYANCRCFIRIEDPPGSGNFARM